MSSKRPDDWRPDPDSGATAGGGPAELAGRRPLKDPASFSVRVDRPADPPRPAPIADTTRTDVIPKATVPPVDTPTDAYSARRLRPAARRVRRTLKHVDPKSVLKLSLFYYACFLAIWLVIVAFLYWTLAAMGLWDLISSVSDAFALKERLNINLLFVEKWAFVAGVVLVLVGSVVNVFLAFLYNAGADALGGIEMTFVERDL